MDWNIIDEILSARGYTDLQKLIIRRRIVAEIKRLKYKYQKLMVWHSLLMTISFIGSTLITSFLTLEKIIGQETTTGYVFFWIAYALSVLVLIAHKFIFGYNIHKKVVLYNGLLDKYNSELWKFLEEIDKYLEFDTSEQRFEYLCSKFEKLKAKFDQESSNLVAQINRQNGKPMSQNGEGSDYLPRLGTSIGSNIRRIHESRTPIEPSNEVVIPMDNTDATEYDGTISMKSNP